MSNYTSDELAVLAVIDGGGNDQEYNVVSSRFNSTTYGPLTEEETYQNQELCANFMTEIFFRRWLKDALPEEEFQQTTLMSLGLLEKKYPKILDDGPRAFIWENYLLHFENFLKKAKSFNSSKKIEGKKFLKDFISIYYEENSVGKLGKDMYSLVRDNGRISNYWFDSDSIMFDKKYLPSRVLFNKYWKKRSNRDDTPKLTKAFDHFARYSLMADLIKGSDNELKTHQTFILRYNMDQPIQDLK